MEPISLQLFKNVNVKKLENAIGSGNLKNHLTFWKTLTTDVNILEIVQGYKIEFPMMPYQHSPRETPVPKISVKFNSGRDRFIAPKTSHYYSTGNAERIYFNNIFSSEKIRRDASDYKFETIEQFCGDNSLQNGNSSDSIEPTSRRRFSSECGSKRCVLQYSNTSAASQISEIPLEKSKVRVPVPTFRSKICTTDFHKMYKTNYVRPEVSWLSGDHFFGWEGVPGHWRRQVFQ